VICERSFLGIAKEGKEGRERSSALFLSFFLFKPLFSSLPHWIIIEARDLPGALRIGTGQHRWCVFFSMVEGR